MSKKHDRRQKDRGRITWQGFAAFDRPGGNLIWGSLSLKDEWARQWAEHHNLGNTKITVLPVRVIVGGNLTDTTEQA